MPEQVTKLKLFVASPGDVKNERDTLIKVSEELNRTVAATKNVVLEVVRWETHAHPDWGEDPQDVINRQIGAADIFVGILWNRIGTQTKRAESGTIEEFERARHLWNQGLLGHILLYFKTTKSYLRTSEELDQRGKVIQFRESVDSLALVKEFGARAFADLVRSDLANLIRAWNRPAAGTPPPDENVIATRRVEASAPAAAIDIPLDVLPGFPGHLELLERSRKRLNVQLENEVWPGDPTPKNKYPYIAHLYVPRTPIDELFEVFLESDYSVFAVVGESGFGKSNFLCHLATRRLGDGNLVLFYPGYGLCAGGRSVRSRILGDLGLEDSFEFLLRRLERVLPARDKLFVLLDSVERCEEPPTLASELDELVQVIRGRPVRLVVTCRTLAWPGFVTEPGGAEWMRPFATPNVAAAAVDALATLGRDEALVAVCLEYLASLQNDEWKYCCCAVLRALPRLSRAYDRVIHRIAEDRDFRLRRFLVDCVADRYSPEARRDLVDAFVCATDRWEFRETIAAILERDDAPDESLLDAFLDAGDAFHWRERRAAGYGLNRLWQSRIGQRHRDAVVSGWHSLSWRQKYTLSIALLDSEASGPSATASALKGMAVDTNPYVRWGIANYVTRYQEPDDLLCLLVEDKSPWVRSRVVKSLGPEAVSSPESDEGRALQRLVRDDDPEVRLAVCRSALADPKTITEWGQAVLWGYMNNEPKDVAFAAAYSTPHCSGCGSALQDERSLRPIGRGCPSPRRSWSGCASFRVMILSCRSSWRCPGSLTPQR